MHWKRSVGVLGGIVDTRHVGPLDDFALRNGPEVHLVLWWQNTRHFWPKTDIVTMKSWIHESFEQNLQKTSYLTRSKIASGSLATESRQTNRAWRGTKGGFSAPPRRAFRETTASDSKSSKPARGQRQSHFPFPKWKTRCIPDMF